MHTKRTALICKAQSAGEGRTLFVASTAAEDSYRDVVLQDGWRLNKWAENPVILWAHDSSQLPVGKGVKAYIQNDQLMVEVEWAPTPFAQDVAKLYAGGFLNAVSVGFRPLKYKPKSDGGLIFEEQELLEVSAVPIPANHEALAVRAAAGSPEVEAITAWARRWCELVAPMPADPRLDQILAWQARIDAEAEALALKSLPSAQQLLIRRLADSYGLTLRQLIEAAAAPDPTPAPAGIPQDAPPIILDDEPAAGVAVLILD